MTQPWWRDAAAALDTPKTPEASDAPISVSSNCSSDQLLVARGKLLLARYRRQKATGHSEPLDAAAQFYRWPPPAPSAALLGGPPASADSAPRRTPSGFSASSNNSNRLTSSRKAHSSADLARAGEDIGAPPDDGRRHTIADFATPLPAGWEMRASAAGAVFFVNRRTHESTWDDPREQEGRGGAGDETSNTQTVGATPSLLHRRTDVSALRVKIPTERKAAFGSYENTVTPGLPPLGSQQDEDGVQYFDVVFKERGPIGIHFQANDPDGGATVRRLLPGTAAVETGILRPFDQLVAVNQHPVDTASFRHVMILLQGGLRPLTLSFKRDLTHPHGAMAAGFSSQRDGTDLDEEVVLDCGVEEHDGTALSYGERRRSSRELIIRQPDDRNIASSSRRSNHHEGGASSHTATPSSTPAQQVPAREDESVADKIITNLFSLFWTPPEPVPAGEVHTV